MFDGNSIANPEVVLAQLRAAPDEADIIVVSSPGVDQLSSRTVDEMLAEYGNGSGSVEAIQDRFLSLSDQLGVGLTVAKEIPRNLQEWPAQNEPIESLGAYWTAKLFAESTGRQLIEPKEIIIVGENGYVDQAASRKAIGSTLFSGKKYVVPGGVGIGKNGKTELLKAGPCTTGAAIASAIDAQEYHLWTDTAGFMSADPQIVPEAYVVPEMTYREAREPKDDGYDISSASVIKLLAKTDVKTIMQNALSSVGDSRTTVVRERDWQQSPVVAIRGHEIISLTPDAIIDGDEARTSYQAILRLYSEAAISLRHNFITTVIESHSMSFSSDAKNEEAISSIAQKVRQSGLNITVKKLGEISVIGQGNLEDGLTCSSVFSTVYEALKESGVKIERRDQSYTPSILFSVEPDVLNRAIRTSYESLGIDQIK
jgi:aspartokinase